jgi:hypothetical protein
MNADQLHAAQKIGDAARALSELANSAGLILTIETRPKAPLAMGNYTIVVGVRPSHEAYRRAP